MIKSVYIFSMDCLVSNGRPKKGAVELCELLYRQKVPFAVMSEQSGKSREKMVEEMRVMGFTKFRPANLYTSSMAAVDFLSSHFPAKKRAALIGGAGIREAVETASYELTRLHPDFIFLGMDRSLTYDDYCEILAMIEEGGIIVNVDERKTQVLDNQRMIGNASVVKMLEYASGTEAISFGRGTPLYLDMVLRYLSADPAMCVFVGKSFSKDIVPARNRGMTTVYVTEGRSIVNEGMNEKIHPDYIVEDLSGLTR